jgi:hypothetical protein
MAGKSVRRWGLLAFVAIAAALPIASAIPYVEDWLRASKEEDADPPPGFAASSNPLFNSPFIMDGSLNPQIVAGFEAKIDDNEEVIGVELRERHRAYRLIAFKKRPHVVNDLVDRIPVTVTCCPITRRSQAFIGERTNVPLPIGLGGWANGSMLLKDKHDFFLQSNGLKLTSNPNDKPVFPILSHQRVTWKIWRESHPDTDVCIDY